MENKIITPSELSFTHLKTCPVFDLDNITYYNIDLINNILLSGKNITINLLKDIPYYIIRQLDLTNDDYWLIYSNKYFQKTNKPYDETKSWKDILILTEKLQLYFQYPSIDNNLLSNMRDIMELSYIEYLVTSYEALSGLSEEEYQLQVQVRNIIKPLINSMLDKYEMLTNESIQHKIKKSQKQWNTTIIVPYDIFLQLKDIIHPSYNGIYVYELLKYPLVLYWQNNKIIIQQDPDIPLVNSIIERRIFNCDILEKYFISLIRTRNTTYGCCDITKYRFVLTSHLK